MYDAFGRLAAEYRPDAVPSGTSYFTQDHLGSTRLETDASGQQVKCSDYLPFGEEIPAGYGSRSSCFNANDNRIKFTSKERDAETGLDYFLARYYSGAHGRFTSPDPLMASAYTADPQTWNRYAYVRNNPTNLIDPDGRQTWGPVSEYQYNQSMGQALPYVNGISGTGINTYDTCYSGYIQGQIEIAAYYDAVRWAEVYNIQIEQNQGVTTTSTVFDSGQSFIYDESFATSGSDTGNGINLTKLFVSLCNAANSGRLYAAGMLKLAVSGGLLATGAGSPVGVGTSILGVANVYSAGAAWNRSVEQWNSALQQGWSDATWRNLYGLAPSGQYYDDPGEPTMIEYWRRNGQSVLDNIREIGTILP